MNSFREQIKNWFGYSRRERRSTFILLIIVIIIIASRYSVPEKNLKIEYVSTGFSGIESTAQIIAGDNSAIRQTFYFDPNNVSYDTLIQLGLTSREANTLLNYRNKGGKFKNSKDIKKVYGIDRDQAEQLIPFVKVASDTSGKIEDRSYHQQKHLLDINNCDSASLVTLPGIGPVLSARIIKYRHLLGGFASVNQLTEVYGLQEETFNLIKRRVYADSLSVFKININTTDYKELSRHPYLEKYEVISILKFRELKGPISGIADLTGNKLITEEKAMKVTPYLRFE